MKWTKEQQTVIDSVERNTLISASAGSGKTAVMIERIMRLICGRKEEPRSEPIPVKRIMMVTFTEAVASELRTKIARSLKKEMLKEGAAVEYLRDQIEDLPLCDISTLHAFCCNLIRSNFQALQIDPSFGILEPESGKLLFLRAVEDVLGEREEQYDRTLDVLTKLAGRKEDLIGLLEKLYRFVVAQPDRERFLEIDAFADCIGDWDAMPAVRDFVARAKRKCAELTEQTRRKREEMAAFELPAGKLAHADALTALLGAGRDAEDFDAFCRVMRSFELPSIGGGVGKDESKSAVSKAYTAFVNENVKKPYLDKWKKIASAGTEECRSQASRQQPYIRCLCDLVRDVDRRYAAYKRENNRLDFDDLEYYAVRLLEDPRIVEEVRARYDKVCVDEYQDINALQEFILRKVSCDGNLFMVGDTKQSIYRFRMTDPEIFRDKFIRYRSGEEEGDALTLNMNFRSDGAVLEFVNRIFDRVMNQEFGGVDYRSDARLGKGNAFYFATVPDPVRVAVFTKDKRQSELELPSDGVYSVRDHVIAEKEKICREGEFIASKIKELVGKQSICTVEDDRVDTRLIEYRDIVLLASARSTRTEEIFETLRAEGIPVDTAALSKNKTDRSVGLMIDWLDLIDNPMQDVPMINVMTSVLYGFSLTQTARIRSRSTECEYFWQAADQYREQDEIGEKLAQLNDDLKRYRRIASFASVSELLRVMIADKHYGLYLDALGDGKTARIGLESFLRSLEDKNYNNSLSAFVSMVRELPEIQVTAVAPQEGNCVRTATVHGSKGLEYPVVFVIDAAQEFARIRGNVLMDRDCGICLKDVDDEEMTYKDSVIYELAKQKCEADQREERLRLLYVALTRAKNMLYVTATKSAGSKREATRVSPDRADCFLDWIESIAAEDSGFADQYMTRPELDRVDADVSRTFRPAFRTPSESIAREIESYLCRPYPYEKSTVQRIKHSVTAINNETGERDDDTGSARALFPADRDYAAVGTAYHRVLECIDYERDSREDVETALGDMVKTGQLTSVQALMIDAEVIARCLRSDIIAYARSHTHMREKEFMMYVDPRALPDRVLEGEDKILLQGTIDLMITGEQVVLVDFKYSSRPIASIKERYRKQIDLYAFAAEKCSGRKVDRKVVYVLGTDEIIEY